MVFTGQPQETRRIIYIIRLNFRKSFYLCYHLHINYLSSLLLHVKIIHEIDNYVNTRVNLTTNHFVLSMPV